MPDSFISNLIGLILSGEADLLFALILHALAPFSSSPSNIDERIVPYFPDHTPFLHLALQRLSSYVTDLKIGTPFKRFRAVL